MLKVFQYQMLTNDIGKFLQGKSKYLVDFPLFLTSEKVMWLPFAFLYTNPLQKPAWNMLISKFDFMLWCFLMKSTVFNESVSLKPRTCLNCMWYTLLWAFAILNVHFLMVKLCTAFVSVLVW